MKNIFAMALAAMLIAPMAFANDPAPAQGDHKMDTMKADTGAMAPAGEAAAAPAKEHGKKKGKQKKHDAASH